MINVNIILYNDVWKNSSSRPTLLQESVARGNKASGEFNNVYNSVVGDFYYLNGSFLVLGH